jgi:hypothetical protein
MSQCLRCRKPCEATAVFCDDCRSRLRTEFRRGPVSPAVNGVNASASVTVARSVSSGAEEQVEQHGGQVGGTLPTLRSQPVTPAPKAPVTPHPPMLMPQCDAAEQAITRLSEAAQRIAEVEPANRRLPHASRLAPFRDISADIRRESTPLPKFSKMRYKTDTHEAVDSAGAINRAPTLDALGDAQQSAKRDLSERRVDGQMLRDDDAAIPDLWPWFDGEADEKENEDTWAGSTDPLISRHIPNSVESARIEEEDIRRALAEGIQTDHLAASVRRRRTSRVRIAFAVLAIFAVIALVVDGVLLSVISVHPRRSSGSAGGFAAATLTLSPNMVNVGRPVQLHIVNFTAGTKAFLSHDIQEVVLTSTGTSIISIRADGSADATIMVGSDWGPGFHQVVAEDITTRFTASATLQVVVPSTQTRPAHLVPDNTALDFGPNIEGANTILPMHLRNSGSGSITWSASSDQPWLLISPSQGMFSQSQTIDIAVQRANLPPKAYSGIITLFSSVDPPQKIKVTMSVRAPLPGPVLSLSPAVLSFTATDGLPSPVPLLLTINNPGTQTLIWSLKVDAPATESTQISISHVLGVKTGWLSANQYSGSILAGATQQVEVSVASNNLLPGAYLGSLMFTAPGAADPSQTVSVSLTVQPHCGLVTNVGFLQFTAVLGKTNPINQALSINATASCAGAPINWKAALSAGWLTESPTSGQLKGTTSETLSVGVNATGLTPGKYYGNIAFTTLTTPQSTQTVQVELIVQPPPPPTAPVMSVSQLNINFSNTQGQPSPKGQVVTITNVASNGGGTLLWKTSVTQIALPWLSTSPTGSPSGGGIMPGQTGQLVVNVDTSRLTPGTYSGLITLNGTDMNGNPASGSPQVVSVNLVIQPPCALTQPSSSSIAFNGVQGGFNPTSQILLITGTGNCTWPLLWSATIPSNASWLTITPMMGSIKGSGQSASFTVAANILGLKANVYTTQVTISATDSAGATAQGSPQTFSVMLTVLPPCMIVPVTTPLSFTVAQGQTSSNQQNVSLGETGTCSRPVTWTTVGDANSSAWLVLTPPAPDTGSGSTLGVNVNTNTQPGTYTGTITVTAVDSNGVAVLGTFTIPVTLNVTATVSGQVIACLPGPAPTCTTSAPLPGATLTLVNSSGLTVATITANSSGNYSFAGLAPGSYTVNVSGTDSGGMHYSSAFPLPVTANATVNLQVYPG